MKTEKEKMLSGELYNAADKQLSAERLRARILMKDLNDACPDQKETRARILKKLIPECGTDLIIEPPFLCDYGYNIRTGDNVFINFNCVMLDVMPIYIGNRTLLGPNVQIYTATHPLNHELRTAGLEYGKAVTIGEDVWIGGNVVICPGVNIGDRAVIGAGSVVTRDIPPNSLAVGNPCKVVREIE